MAYSTGTLAQGCFGKVYKEKYNDTWAAIKKVPHHLISRKDLERECEVYNKANHPNIVKLLGNITLKDRKWIIPLEFIFGEDLETTIFKASKSKIQLTPSNKGTIIIGMCEGLLHLHSKDIVHQDLKPENIMVEHNTNRAVIIDLGLAKFFRHGLNSAMDMGNEAYSAPEVLQRGSQRDQRSDVWAMGKIIAELCARIRLYTPSVCPTKIKETLKDQPYCQAVCRMVETNPSLRASMGGIISEIRMAGGAGIVTNTAIQRELLRPPSPQVNARNRSPSPMNRGASPMRRDPSPMNRAPSPFNRDPLPVNRAPSPFNRDPSPLNRAPSPFNRDPSPLNRSPSPLKWERSPKPALHLSPSPQRIEDKNKNQALVPTGGANVTQDFMKLRLYQEAAKDLPCNLPTTGRVVVRRFEEKNGEVETWEQKEVVTRDGKIVKFDDVKFNSKLSDFSLSGIRPPLTDHSHLRVLELFEDSEELCEVPQSPNWRVETHSMHSRESMPTLDEYEGYASTSLTNLDVSEDKRKETFPDDSETLKKPRQLVKDKHLDKYEELTFTPELMTESGKTLYRFRCPGPGVFQCAVTGLGFVMGEEAELLYRTVQWDESLLQSAGKIAAGLLFDIKCSQSAAIHQFHLPHCEIMNALPPEGLLSVMHITDDGTSILEPLQITDTHVVVEVSHLSAFGLVMDFLRWVLNRKDTQPVGGQVLLFLGQPNPKTERQKLHVLLLPRNIHLYEVSKQQQHSVNIWAPSSCKLIKDQSYTLHCPQAIKIQPKRADFDLEFGPNFHPTFEIRLPTDTDEVTLTVRDQRDTEIWECDVDLAGYYPDSRRETPQRNVPAVNTVPAEELLFSVRTQFVIRVTNPVLNQLLDKLHEHRVINYEEMQSAKGKERADKARDVIDMAQRKGSEASSVLIDALLELDSWLARALSLR